LLAEQIRQNSRLFFRLAHGLLRNNEAAEDVCQQALLRAWEQRDRLVEPEALRGWLCKVVINESLRLCRRSKLERDWTSHGMIAKPADVEREQQSIDLRESVAAALEKLPQLPRDVVVLRVMGDLKGQEVARILGITEVAVSRQLYQAMERLREHLIDWQTSVGGKS
jgi:RNA polymerase sigma-70 factor (ECF subfamily)